MTKTKGSAETIVMSRRPVRTSRGSSPPASSMAEATPPVATPQKTTVKRLGSVAPFSESPPMTMEAESAPVTKKIATRTTASTMRTMRTTLCTGMALSRSNRIVSKFRSGVPSALRWTRACAAWPARSARSWSPMAPPPKMANQMRETTEGTSMTPVTNCRMVRPREMRAMNIPTKGVQEIHQAQ